jgi:hypothetical protein
VPGVTLIVDTPFPAYPDNFGHWIEALLPVYNVLAQVRRRAHPFRLAGLLSRLPPRQPTSCSCSRWDQSRPVPVLRKACLVTPLSRPWAQAAWADSLPDGMEPVLDAVLLVNVQREQLAVRARSFSHMAPRHALDAACGCALREPIPGQLCIA